MFSLWYLSDAISPSPLPHLRGNIQRLTGLCGIRPTSVGRRHIALGAATTWRLPSSWWLMERLCHRWVSSLRLLLLLHALHLRLPPSPSLRLYLLHLQSLGQLLGREKRERDLFFQYSGAKQYPQCIHVSAQIIQTSIINNFRVTIAYF